MLLLITLLLPIHQTL